MAKTETKVVGAPDVVRGAVSQVLGGVEPFLALRGGREASALPLGLVSPVGEEARKSSLAQSPCGGDRDPLIPLILAYTRITFT